MVNSDAGGLSFAYDSKVASFVQRSESLALAEKKLKGGRRVLVRLAISETGQLHLDIRFPFSISGDAAFLAFERLHEMGLSSVISIHPFYGQVIIPSALMAPSVSVLDERLEIICDIAEECYDVLSEFDAISREKTDVEFDAIDVIDHVLERLYEQANN